MSHDTSAPSEPVVSPIRITRTESHLATLVVPVRVDPLTGEVTASARATGFFWEAGGHWHLVTNVHTLTGWHPQMGRSISSDAFCPTHLDYQVSIDVEPQNEVGRFMLQRKGYRVALEEDGQPAWFEHPHLGDQVDVAVLELFRTPDEEQLRKIGANKMITPPVNRHEGWIDFEPAAADDAYVLGFPKGMSGGRGFPVWKRASIASEPNIDLDGLPKILIDTATREGMSGAPVIAVRRGLTLPTGEFDDQAVIGEAANFLGVYSGRVGDDPMGVQLGIVWKARVIDEILAGMKRGTWPWDRLGGSEDV